MKYKKYLQKLAAIALAGALVTGTVPAVTYMDTTIVAEAASVSGTGYTISKKSGTYSSATTVKIKAKAGYKVYYTTGSSLSTSKVIKSGKSKTIKITSNTTLRVYAVKSSAKITAKKLKSNAVKKKTVSYKYRISTNTDSAAQTEETSTIKLSGNTATIGSKISDSVSESTAGSAKVLTITKAGDYTLTGSGTNIQIEIAKDITDKVTLTLDDLTIDNSALGSTEDEENPVIAIAKGTTNVSLIISGTNKMTGCGHLTKEAANIITAKDSSAKLTLSAATSDSTLTLTDPQAATNEDGASGIKSKGDLTITSGTYRITTAGDALNASDGTLSISGGQFTILSYGDGIQAEQVNITGDPVIDITTKYKNSTVNFYDPSRGSGNYNTLTEDEATGTKTEVFNVDTGSHKGIKGGTKAETVNYKDGTASLTVNASGGINISGGTITIDTTATGTKSDKSIIGDPEDAIHSNNTLTISGGTITVKSADDAITAADAMTITGSSTKVNITGSYEGLEAGTITIGSTASDKPTITITASDDGVNASSKTVTTTYDTADETSGTEVKVSKSGNKLYMNGGSLTVDSQGDGIDCNGSFIANGGTVIVYGPENAGNAPIDYDETFENNGAEILALGVVGMTQATTSGKTSYVEFGATSGQGGMTPPTGTAGGQGGMTPPTGTTGGQGGMTPPTGTTGDQGGMTPPTGGMDGMPQSTSTISGISAGTDISVTDESGNVLKTVSAKRNCNYVFYSAPSLSSGSAYKLLSGTTELATATAK